MRVKLLFFILTSFAFALSAWAQSLSIIPRPLSSTLYEGAGVQLQRDAPLTLWWDARLKGDAQRTLTTVKASGVDLFRAAKKGKEKTAIVEVHYCDTLRNDAYILEIGRGKKQKIEIYAAHGQGAFYALQSLAQLAETQKGDKIELPKLRIYDNPRFSWRGFMLDEGRHFFGKKEVKRVLDIMARYKMNKFHWHLTEDQGWRLQIKGYPRLTEVGAWRSSRTLPFGDVKADTIHYGGFYTPSDVRDIVAYAQARYIDIIPEIDMPGHFQAAIASYPNLLACHPEEKHEVWLGQGVSRDVLNVAKPSAMRMVYAIIDELIELFPSSYIHLGGDECPTEAWTTTPACEQLLQRLGTKNYHDLQTYFYEQIGRYIAKKPKKQQRRMIFWNEVLQGDMSQLPKTVTIMAWTGADKAALKAAEEGYNTILTPQIPYYINRKQSTRADEPHSQGRGHETLRAVYDYVPAKDVPKALLPKYLGVQANFWSEWVDTPEFLEYLILPRLLAVAEAGWTPQAERCYNDFLQRVKRQVPFFEKLHYSYGKAALEGASCCSGKKRCKEDRP